MRVTRGLIAATLAVVFALTLGGCVPQSHKAAPPKPSPNSTPVFASDEEALAAATKAYAAYLKVSDEIAQDGGAHPDRLAKFVTAEWLADEIDDFGTFARTGRHQVGFTKFDEMKLQDVMETGPGVAVVRVYACLDLSAARIEDAAGHDVTPTVAARSPFQVSFESSKGVSTVLVLNGNEPWSGANFC